VSEGEEQRIKVDLTDSGFPMIFATAFVASLRMSEATTVSTGTFVKRFKVGIAGTSEWLWVKPLG